MKNQSSDNTIESWTKTFSKSMNTDLFTHNNCFKCEGSSNNVISEMNRKIESFLKGLEIRLMFHHSF